MTGKTKISAYIPVFTRGYILKKRHPWGLSIYGSFSGLIIQSVSDFLCDKINTMRRHVGMQEDNWTLHCNAYELSPQMVQWQTHTIFSPNQDIL